MFKGTGKIVRDNKSLIYTKHYILSIMVSYAVWITPTIVFIKKKSLNNYSGGNCPPPVATGLYLRKH